MFICVYKYTHTHTHIYKKYLLVYIYSMFIFMFYIICKYITYTRTLVYSDVSSSVFVFESTLERWVTHLISPQLYTWANGSAANQSPCNLWRKSPRKLHQQNLKSQKRTKQERQVKGHRATNLPLRPAWPTSCAQDWWTNPTCLWKRLPGRKC